MKLTNDILEHIFQIARQVNDNSKTLSRGRDELVRSYGFNPNSAIMSINSLRKMINGETYRRALTLDATDYFLTRIRELNGDEAFRIALGALSAHIDYRATTGVFLPGLQSVLAKHSSWIA